MISKIKLRISTITPLIIRSGDDFSMLESLIDKGFLYVFDLKKILISSLSNSFKEAIDKELIEEKKNFEILREFYKKNLSLLENFLIEKISIKDGINISSFQAERIGRFIRYFDFEKQKEIPFIPGSSLKGAFLEVLFSKISKNFEIIKEKQKNLKQKIQQAIGFEDFYFNKAENKIIKLTRYNPFKRKEQVKIYVQAIEGEAEGFLYFPKRAEELREVNLFEMIKNILILGSEYYLLRNRYFFSFFSFSFQKTIKNALNCLILPLGFGSRSFQRKKGSTYFSFSDSFPYDPVGVVSLRMIE